MRIVTKKVRSNRRPLYFRNEGSTGFRIVQDCVRNTNAEFDFTGPTDVDSRYANSDTCRSPTSSCRFLRPVAVLLQDAGVLCWISKSRSRVDCGIPVGREP